MKPRRSDLVRAWARSFAVQGSWNYRTLLGCGIAYAMLPLLRRVHAGHPVRLRQSIERHMRSFNGHPYLCAMAISALARLEFDEVDGEKVDRFRTALRGPLGTVGDHAVWAQWRPFCLLAAIVGHGVGLSPLGAVALFLVLYNAGHLYLRIWAFREGWSRGLEVGKVLGESWLDRLTERLSPANLALLGAAAVSVSWPVVREWRGGEPAWALLASGGALALLAFRWPRRGGRLAVAVVFAAVLAWIASASGRIG